MGIQNIFAMPGNFTDWFISATSLSHVIPSLHSLSGLSVTTVSTILSGAESVGDSERPILPNTLSTSGNFISILSCIWRILDASVIDIPGTAVGLYRIVTSFSGGMNSEPSLRKGKTVRTSITTDANKTVFLKRSTNFTTGSYSPMRNLLMGFFSSGFTFPVTSRAIKAGVIVIARRAEKNIENVFVNARGLNSLPSWYSRVKIGRKDTVTSM